MTPREINKLKLIRKINPNIDVSELEKYSCKNCSNRQHRCQGGFSLSEYKKVIIFEWLNKETGMREFFPIFICFEGEKSEENQEG